jgi:hypothetical protein
LKLTAFFASFMALKRNEKEKKKEMKKKRKRKKASTKKSSQTDKSLTNIRGHVINRHVQLDLWYQIRPNVHQHIGRRRQRRRLVPTPTRTTGTARPEVLIHRFVVTHLLNRLVIEAIPLIVTFRINVHTIIT